MTSGWPALCGRKIVVGRAPAFLTIIERVPSLPDPTGQ